MVIGHNILAADLKLYYSLVNKAEIAIIHDRPDEAMTFYEQAFNKKERPFATDIYNAAVCALKSNNNKKALEYCTSLAKRGVGKRFFEQSLFIPLRPHLEFPRLLTVADSMQQYLSEKNRSVINRLASLTQQDQDYHQLLRPASGTEQYDSIYNAVRTVDNLTSRTLLQMFSEYELTEFRLGPFMLNDSTLCSTPGWYIIILHNYQGKFKDTDTLFSGILQTYIREGKIKPESIAALMDNGSSMKGKKFYGQAAHLFHSFGNKLYRNRHYFKDESSILSENRNSLMLYPIEDLQQRVVYNFNHRENNPYLINGLWAISGDGNSDPDEELYELIR